MGSWPTAAYKGDLVPGSPKKGPNSARPDSVKFSRWEVPDEVNGGGREAAFIFLRQAPSEAVSKRATNSMACVDLDPVTACQRSVLKAASCQVSGLLPRNRHAARASRSPELRCAVCVADPDVAGEPYRSQQDSRPDQPPEAADSRYQRQKRAAPRAQTSLRVASP